MTSTLNHDTGDIRFGDGTRDLTYMTQRPAMRRPEVTGELPIFQPTGTLTIDGQTIPIADTATLVGVAELARLAASETMVLPVPAPPIDSLPETVRRPAPTTHRASPPAPEPVRPPGYRGTRRMVVPPPVTPSWPWLVLPLVGAALMLLSQVALLQVAIRVSGAVL